MNNSKYIEKSHESISNTVLASENMIDQTYLKDMTSDMEKEIRRTQAAISQGFSKEELGSFWGKLRSNIKEVFSNARTNIKNKEFKNVFMPHQHGSTQADNQCSNITISENEEVRKDIESKDINTLPVNFIEAINIPENSQAQEAEPIEEPSAGGNIIPANQQTDYRSHSWIGIDSE